MILLASATEMSAPQIAQLYLTDASMSARSSTTSTIVASGRLTLTIGAGVPKKTTPRQRDEIVWRSRARRPEQPVIALTRRSIDKLARHLAEQGVAQRRHGAASRAG